MITLERTDSTVADQTAEPLAPELSYLVRHFPHSNVFIDTDICENFSNKFLLTPTIEGIPVVHAIFDYDPPQMIKGKEDQLKGFPPNQIGLEFALGLIEAIAIGDFQTKMDQLPEKKLNEIKSAHYRARGEVFDQVSARVAKRFIQPNLAILQREADIRRVICAVSKIERFSPTVQHGFLIGMRYLHELGFASSYVFSGDRGIASAHPSFVQGGRSLMGLSQKPITMYHPHAG